MLIVTKPDMGGDIQWAGPTHIPMVLQLSGLKKSSDKLYNIFMSTILIATKHGKVVTNCEWFPPIKSHNQLSMW